MTDLFGPWDALLLLVVAAVFAVALYWKRLYRPPQDVSQAWLRGQDSEEWTRGYEGVNPKWETGARWKDTP